jgi:syntaxin 5
MQNSYIQSRSTAIESIESTIAELGQIFSQLANMVAEQRETVQRIDADTHDIAANVTGAQRELMKYYAGISNNRWLMLKLFGVLIIFVSALVSCSDQG